MDSTGAPPDRRLQAAVFGDESRYPPTDGLVQVVSAQQRVLYGETRDGQVVAKGLISRVSQNEVMLTAQGQQIKDLQDRRLFWIQMGASAVTLLGVLVQLLLALRAAGII